MNLPEIEKQIALQRMFPDAGDVAVELRADPAAQFWLLKRAIFSAALAGAKSLSFNVGERGPYRIGGSPAPASEKTLPLTVVLDPKAILIMLGGTAYPPVSAIDGGARSKLDEIKKNLPDQRAVRLLVDDAVTAALLADTFAQLLAAGLDDIALLPRGSNVDVGGQTIVGMGMLDKEEIRKVIHTERAKIRKCYETQLLETPSLHGKVSVKFTISAEGPVSQAEIAESTTKHPKLEGCLVTEVKRWRFPKPRGGGIVVVTYPFIFSSGSDAGAP